MENTLAFFASFLRKDFTDYCEVQLRQIGLTQGLLFFVLYVGKHPNCSPGDLSQDLGFDRGHTTRSLTKLEEAGFLLRTRSETDGRAFSLLLTEKGQFAFQKSHDLFGEWDKAVMKDLSSEEKSTLLTILEKT